MVNNNVCDLDKLIDGALSFLDAGETGTVSKEARALLGSSEAKPSTTTTKGGKTTKGKGKPKKAPAVDPKVAQLRADYEALNAIQHERDLQYRELQAENRRLNKALQDKKAKQTAEAKLAYEKRKAERTPEQQAKIDAQTQKMLEGAKRAREAKKALAGTVEPKETASNSKPTKPLSLKELVERARAKKEAPKNVPIPKEKITYGVNKEALKAKEQRAKIDAEIKRKQDLKDATEAKYKGDALKAKLKELQNDPVALENAKQAMDGGIAPQTSDELLANLLVKSQAERKATQVSEIAKGIADYNREIKNAPTREKRQAQTDLINKTNETYKGEALQAKLKELEANPKALLKAKKQIENGVDPLTPDDLLAHKLVRQAMATGKSKPLVSDLSKGFADYNREKASAPAREAQQARKDLLATTDAQYKGDNLQAKLKEIKANEEAMANAKKQIEANQDPTTPEELLAHNLVKQAENKSKIKPKITDLSKGFSKFANNERLAPKREAQALFNTKQQEIRNDINKAFENPDGTVDEKALQEHIQTLRDDDLLLAEARDEVANKIAPYSIDSYLAHEIVKKLDAEPKEKKTADPTVEAVRKALNKTEDPNVLRQKEQRKQDIQGFEEELLAKYDTVDKLKKAVQAVKDNPDLLEETRKLIANGGFPTTLEQYIAMHQLKREKKPAGMPNKPSDLSKALTSVNRKVEPKEPPAPFSWLSDALSNKDNLNKATNALEGKKTPPSLKQMLGIKSKFKTPIEIQQAKEKAHRKKLDNYLIEKVPNATPRMRKSAVDRLMELYADGRTLTPEQFKTVMKQEMVPSGVTASFQNKLKKLQARLDAETDFDVKMKLNGEISQLVGDLTKPTVGEKASTILQMGMLGGVKSFERDFFGGFVNSSISGINPFSGLVKPKSYSFLKQSIIDAWHGKNTLNPEGTTDNRSTFKLESSVGKFFERLLKVRLTVADAIWLEHVYTAKKEMYVKQQGEGYKLTNADKEMLFHEAEKALLKDDNKATKWAKVVQNVFNGNLPETPKNQRKNFGVGTLLFPFVKFPVNATRQILHLSSLLDVKDTIIPSNERSRKEAVQAFVRKLPLNAGLALLGIVGGASGFITPSYDPKTFDSEEAENRPPDSIIIGDRAIPFSQIMPLSPYLKAWANVGREGIKGTKPTDIVFSALGGAFSGIFDTLKGSAEGGVLQGTENLIKNSKEGNDVDVLKGLYKTALEQSTYIVPAVIKEGATLVNDAKINTKDTDSNSLFPFKTLGNKFLSKVKVGTQDLDVTGKPLKDSFAFDPFNTKIVKADPVIKELRKVSRKSGVDVQLKQVDNNFRIGKELAEDYGTEPQNMKLNAQDFAKWQEIHNNMVYQSVKTMVESEDYKSLTDPLDKADEIKNAKKNPFVEIDGKDYTPKELFLEYKLKGRVVNINK